MSGELIRYGIKIYPERDSWLEESAIGMLMDFYAISGETSPQEVFARSSVAWSTFHKVTDWNMAAELYRALSHKWMSFASPTTSNAPAFRPNGNNPYFEKQVGMPISCFLGYVPDTIKGLIDHSSELRYLSVNGGGVGGHWSDVRSISKKSPGPMPFIGTIDRDMVAYKQGETRKGSYAAYLSVDHPDFEEFLMMRTPTGDNNRKNLNLHHGANITDEFMAAVSEGTEIPEVDPKTGPTGKMIDARSRWNRILETRFRTGEPYCNFIDRANELMNPFQKAMGLKIHGSNLCTEIHLATSPERTAVCCLASPNLELWDEWENTRLIQIMTRALDNVLEYFIENAPPEMSRAVFSAKQERSIGIGAMGFHSLLMRKMIPFESEEAAELNKRIFRHIKESFVEESKRLAIERGEPPDLVGSGMRNANGLAPAPNASTSILLSTSPSTEPLKAVAYAQRTRAGTALRKNEYLRRVLAEMGRDTPEVWSSIITTDGSVQHLDFLSDFHKAVFRTFFEIDQFWVVKHAGDRQEFICQGQSVNLAFRPGASRAYVREVHEYAYHAGLKSLYYLRTESKSRPENLGSEVVEDKLADFDNTVVYGKPGCSQCESAKRLLDSKGIEYDYVDLVEAGKTAAEVTGRPDVRSLPQIYLRGKYLGGLRELVVALNNKQFEPEPEPAPQPDVGNLPMMDDDSTCRSCEG